MADNSFPSEAAAREALRLAIEAREQAKHKLAQLEAGLARAKESQSAIGRELNERAGVMQQVESFAANAVLEGLDPLAVPPELQESKRSLELLRTQHEGYSRACAGLERQIACAKGDLAECERQAGEAVETVLSCEGEARAAALLDAWGAYHGALKSFRALSDGPAGLAGMQAGPKFTEAVGRLCNPDVWFVDPLRVADTWRSWRKRLSSNHTATLEIHE